MPAALLRLPGTRQQKVRLKGRKTVEEERGGIWGASVTQNLSGVLSTEDVDSGSAASARILDLRSKIFKSNLGTCWSMWCREKGCRRHIKSGSRSYGLDIDAQRVLTLASGSCTMTQAVSEIKFSKTAHKCTAWPYSVVLKFPPALQLRLMRSPSSFIVHGHFRLDMVR
jgi:hypothetical protein